MRIMRRFSVADLQRTASAEYCSAVKWLSMLKNHGYVERTCPGAPGRPAEYRLVKDAGPEYPLRCDVCGRQLTDPCLPASAARRSCAPRQPAETARAAMWNHMQASRRFSIADLCRIPGVSMPSAYKWTAQLKNHGYVERLDASGRMAEYRMILRDRECPVSCRSCGRPLHKKGCWGEKSQKKEEPC